MRDRREALKLLAGGTAAAIGTSIITTNTAFARNGGTVTCRPTGTTTALAFGPGLSVRDNDGTTQAVRIRIASSNRNIGSKSCVACSAGSPTSTTAATQYLWTFDSQPGGFGLSLQETGNFITTFIDASAVNRDVFIRRTAGGNFQTSTSSPSSLTFTVRLTLRWRCRYGTAFAWNCESYTAMVRWNNNGNNDDTAEFITPANGGITTFGPVAINAACATDPGPEVP